MLLKERPAREPGDHPDAAGAAPVERELKLKIREQDASRLRTHPALTRQLVGEPRTARLISTYYDTLDHALSRHGVALRVRREGRRRIQTLKLPGADRDAPAVLANRQEFEWTIAQDEPDIAAVTEKLRGWDGAADLPPIEPGSLRPIFLTDILRTKLELRWTDETHCIAALDIGHVAAGPCREPIAELELELRAGRPGRLYELALALHHDVPMMLSVESKGDIGKRLALGAPPTVSKAAPPRLDRDLTVADGFTQLVQACLAHWLANQAAGLAGHVEGVHQMRVAMRRLKSAFNLFKPYVAEADYAAMRDALRSLGRTFGEARDWDVFIDYSLASAAVKPAMRDPARRLADVAEPLRVSAHERVSEAIRAPDYTTFLLTTSRRLEQRRWVARLGTDRLAALGEPLATVGDQLLEREDRKVRKSGRHVASLSPEARHELRKRLKKLRYGVEFLQSLYPERRVKPVLEPLKSVLELLGEANDLVVAQRLLAQAVAHAGPDHARLGKTLQRRWEKRQTKRLDTLPALWHRFSRVRPFWEHAH